MEESWIDNVMKEKENEGFERSMSLKRVTGVNAADLPKLPAPAPVAIEEDFEDDLNIDRKNPVPPDARNASMSQEVNINNISLGHKKPKNLLEVIPEQPQKPDPNQKMTKKVFCLNLIGVIVGCVSSFLIMYCFFRAYKSFSKDYFPFESIKEIWSKDTIKDLHLSINGKCPTPSHKPLIEYDWSGLKEGCDCLQNSGGLEKKVHAQACTAEMKSKGCLESKAIEGRMMRNWRDKGVFLCVERYPGTNMEKMILNSNMDEQKWCKPGFKLCPPAPTDPKTNKESLSWAMCVPNSLESCPLTKVQISKCTTNPDINCFDDISDKKVSLNAQDCLWKSNRCGRGPISSLVIGEDGICRFLSQNQISENHEEYSLVNIPRNKCTLNPDVEKLDSIPQKEFFGLNGVTLDNAKGFEENIKNFQFSIYSLYYTKWTWPHRNQDDVYLIFNNKKYIDRLESYHSSGLEFFAIYVALCLFFAPVLFYFEAKNPEIYKYNRILLCAKYTILWFFKIAAIPVILLVMKLNNDISSKFKGYAEAGFSNDFENNKMKELALSLNQKIYTWDRLALWIACAVIIIDVILMVMICTSEKHKMKTEDVDIEHSLTDGVEMGTQ